jgi:hypothetical protein
MKFYGNGAVWDGAANKICARFQHGVFETEDSALIARLDAMGISHAECEGSSCTESVVLGKALADGLEDGLASSVSGAISEATRSVLISWAKARGIRGADRMSKGQLVEVLRGEES